MVLIIHSFNQSTDRSIDDQWWETTSIDKLMIDRLVGFGRSMCWILDKTKIANIRSLGHTCDQYRERETGSLFIHSYIFFSGYFSLFNRYKYYITHRQVYYVIIIIIIISFGQWTCVLYLATSIMRFVVVWLLSSGTQVMDFREEKKVSINFFCSGKFKHRSYRLLIWF